MGWWILVFIAAVIVVGWVAHKYPTLFGAAVADGAAVVNAIDNKVKSSTTAAPAAAPAVVANTAANTATH